MILILLHIRFAEGGFYAYSWLGFEGPYSLQIFGGVPDNIVGAVQWTDNYIYFFTNNFLYYQCSPWYFNISRGYPRYTHVDWIGCSGDSLDSGNLRLAKTAETLPKSVGGDVTETVFDPSSAQAASTWTFAVIILSLSLIALVQIGVQY